jgi:hypothetical protein
MPTVRASRRSLIRLEADAAMSVDGIVGETEGRLVHPRGEEQAA